MRKTFTWAEFGENFESLDDDHGHNVIATDFPGFTADATLAVAPGGIYPSNILGCTSCHDPHGKKNDKTGPISGSGSYGNTPEAGTELGNFRLLGDTGYVGASSGLPFTAPVPVATAADFFAGAFVERDDKHTDFGVNMSEWCANCHTNFLSSVNQTKHAASNDANLGTSLSNNYNLYVRSGDLTGTADDAYLALVPFERGINDSTALDSSSTQGTTATSNVMCLSCHRAHASAFQNAGRWDFTAQFIADSHPAVGDGGVEGNDVINSYYQRDMLAQFGQFQRSLCNKCHAQD
jgi:cytochrome c553